MWGETTAKARRKANLDGEALNGHGSADASVANREAMEQSWERVERLLAAIR